MVEALIACSSIIKHAGVPVEVKFACLKVSPYTLERWCWKSGRVRRVSLGSYEQRSRRSAGVSRMGVGLNRMDHTAASRNIWICMPEKRYNFIPWDDSRCIAIVVVVPGMGSVRQHPD